LVSHIFVNHVGFVPGGAKHFVVTEPPEEKFSIVRRLPGRPTVLEGQLKKVSRDLGAAWIGNFSKVREEGNYLIRCGDVESRPVTIYRGIYDQPLRVIFNYFPTQRCGESLKGWHAPCHTRDARRVDTCEHVDVAGGWHQSCDLRKWTFGTSFGLLGLSQFGMLRLPKWDSGHIAEEIKWGNQYFHKMVRPDGGLMDHVVLPLGWCDERDVYPNDPPAKSTYTVIAGQAMVARFFKNVDEDYSRECVKVARRIWSYITGPSYPKESYEPPVIPKYHEWMRGYFSQNYPRSALHLGEGLFSAVQMYQSTGDKDFLERACRQASALVDLQIGGDVSIDPVVACFRVDPERSDIACTYNEGYFGPLGLCELLEIQPNHPEAERWRNAISLIAQQNYVMAERNPWGLVPCYWYAQDQGGGRQVGSGYYRYFFQYGRLRIGVNPDILGSALFLLRAQKVSGDSRCFEVACRQLDWVLGCNPFDASTVEGVGRNQPERLINTDEFFPPVPQIPGAVMTGIKGDEKDEAAPFTMGVEAEYDMPPTALLMWLMSELSTF